MYIHVYICNIIILACLCVVVMCSCMKLTLVDQALAW